MVHSEKATVGYFIVIKCEDIYNGNQYQVQERPPTYRANLLARPPNQDCLERMRMSIITPASCCCCCCYYCCCWCCCWRRWWLWLWRVCSRSRSHADVRHQRVKSAVRTAVVRRASPSPLCAPPSPRPRHARLETIRSALQNIRLTGLSELTAVPPPAFLPPVDRPPIPGVTRSRARARSTRVEDDTKNTNADTDASDKRRRANPRRRERFTVFRVVKT